MTYYSIVCCVTVWSAPHLECISLKWFYCAKLIELLSLSGLLCVCLLCTGPHCCACGFYLWMSNIPPHQFLWFQPHTCTWTIDCSVILATCLRISLTVLSTDIVDKTASFVARNGPEFEARIRQNEIGNPKFNFLNFGDPYHAYYQFKVKDFREGRGE